jgi:hypothetical protein
MADSGHSFQVRCKGSHGGIIMRLKKPAPLLGVLQFDLTPAEKSKYMIYDTGILRFGNYGLTRDGEFFYNTPKSYEEFLLRLSYDLDRDFDYTGVADFVSENKREFALINHFFQRNVITEILSDMKNRRDAIDKDIKRLTAMESYFDKA